MGAAIILISLAAISALLILLPFDKSRRRAADQGEHPSSALAGELDSLLARKDSLYVAIKDLDFEHATGKLSTGDYETLKEAYARDAIEVLKDIDEREAQLEATRAAAKKRAGRNASKKKGVGVFCSECGAQLDASDRYCARCGSSQALICAQCGAEYDRGNQFCSGCGAELAIGKMQQPAID